jgi:hypothetical protein
VGTAGGETPSPLGCQADSADIDEHWAGRRGEDGDVEVGSGSVRDRDGEAGDPSAGG